MSLSKRVDQARDAFKKGDMAGSAAAHSADWIVKAAREEHGGTSHQYIGDMVYGGLDGIITTFAVVSGVAGAQLGSEIILILGLANLLADGFSMGTGAYLSSKSEQEYYDHEWQREAWEVEHFPDGERAELREIYRQQGYSEEDAQSLVNIHSRHPKLWVRAMMVDELGLMENERKPMYSALATFIAFVIAGAVPLLVYLADLVIPVAPSLSFPIALALSGAALFALGASKVLITKGNAFRNGLEMLVVGGLAAGVAYGVGAILRSMGLGG